MILLSLLLSALSYAHVFEDVIYGEDNRVEASDALDALHLSDSSVALISQENLREFHGYVTPFGPPLGLQQHLCPEERFIKQETPAFCSGVLVAPDLVLTAAHCVDDLEDCRATRFVFGYRTEADGSFPRHIPASEVYQCREVAQREQLGEVDFALVRLDHAVPNHRPAFVAPKISVKRDSRLLAIGYPLGLPMKFALNGQVRDMRKNIIKTNLDTLSGNSGSGVFDAASGEFEGILISGDDDFVKARGRACYVNKHCQDDSCQGEDVLKASSILSRSSILSTQ